MAKNKSFRGLGDIMPEVSEAYERSLQDRADRVVELEIDEIMTNPYQPRKIFAKEALEELAQSIKEHGLLQPILVISENGRYILIAGERRLRASKLAKMPTIRAIIVDIEQEKMREVALIENIQREDLNPLELAKSYKELLESYQMTQDELAQIVKKSRAHVANTMRLLALSKQVQTALLEEKITFGHAKILVGLDENKQELALNSIMGQRLNVRQTEDLVRNMKDNQMPPNAPKHFNREQTFFSSINKEQWRYLEEELKNKYHLKLSFKGDKIVLQCCEKTDLKALIEKLMP
ncbi:ParB/RepB/Spo0J family partition protein [Helicobacter cetorum]|uniref:ParB/RepB/Spo0J family partition protein n=1 Tax=Helicobacter cetorum TaxID=138563 RepID=UPI000CF07AAB|nr:ParB/RepB/Spo0J family partition protein [Helicobacter cetorum]